MYVLTYVLILCLKINVPTDEFFESVESYSTRDPRGGLFCKTMIGSGWKNLCSLNPCLDLCIYIGFRGPKVSTFDRYYSPVGN